MGFRVYKPKSLVNVQAELITKENVHDLARRVTGRLVHGENKRGDGPNVTGFQIATFDGIKDFTIGGWYVKNEAGDETYMPDAEFTTQYELLRKTGGTN